MYSTEYNELLLLINRSCVVIDIEIISVFKENRFNVVWELIRTIH